MATQYPGSIDTTVTLPLVFDLISPVLADDHNRLRNAIVAIQNELGTNPSGTFGTAKDRLDSIDSLINTIVAYIMSISAYQVSIADIDGYFAATTVEDALRELVVDVDALLSAPNSIGPAEDGSYTDGLFEDFTPDTLVGSAVDRFNEVLKELAPAPAPNLTTISYTTAVGSQGALSFGASNTIPGYTSVGNESGEGTLDIGQVFSNSSTARKGIYAATFGSKSGDLAGDVVADQATPTPSYPAKAFGNANQGILEIYVNGIMIHSVDLSVFSSGTTNTAGTGFTLSTATPTSFPNGSPFALFYYRTGTWSVSTTHERNGYNYVQVKHTVGTTTYSSNIFEWVIDDSTTATSYVSESLTGLSLTGSKYISGVEYYTGGTASYSVTVQNAYRNTYSSSVSAIFHTASTNGSMPASAITTISGPSYQASTLSISKTFTITAQKLLNDQITARTSTLRTAQATVSSTGVTQSFILLNSVSDTASATNEVFDGELYRVPSNRSLTDTSGFTLGGAGLWDSTISLASVTPGYSDGLLVYDGSLYYPSSASVVSPNAGDFSAVANGPAGNPDYSALTGAKTYLRYFYFTSPAQNFVLNITHSGANFKTVASGLTFGTSDANIEILAPNTTTNGVSVEFKDAIVSYTNDNSIGCHAATYGNTAYTAWGITLGSKSTATSGNAIILRVTVPSDWTATISNISITAA